MKDLVKVIKRKKDKNKEPLSDLAITRLENEEILQHARRFGLNKIKHPENIANGILPGQKLKNDQVLLELGITKKEIVFQNNSIAKEDPKLLGEYRALYKKELRKGIKDGAEDYLGSIFKKDTDIHIDADKKARLALDILKATEKEYNQSIGNQVSINLGELPLGDGLFEAQKKLVLELGITSDIFDNIEN